VTTNALREIAEVRGRFHRSVRLTQDWKEGRDLGGYLLTPTARGLAKRMLLGLSEQGGSRAWSVTGPYGFNNGTRLLTVEDAVTYIRDHNWEGSR
jgi:hypothetical protein